MVDLDDFREAVSTFSLGLGEAEVRAFFEGFDSDGSGGIDFEAGKLPRFYILCDQCWRTPNYRRSSSFPGRVGLTSPVFYRLQVLLGFTYRVYVP